MQLSSILVALVAASPALAAPIRHAWDKHPKRDLEERNLGTTLARVIANAASHHHHDGNNYKRSPSPKGGSHGHHYGNNYKRAPSPKGGSHGHHYGNNYKPSPSPAFDEPVEIDLMIRELGNADEDALYF